MCCLSRSEGLLHKKVDDAHERAKSTRAFLGLAKESVQIIVELHYSDHPMFILSRRTSEGLILGSFKDFFTDGT